MASNVNHSKELISFLKCTICQQILPPDELGHALSFTGEILHITCIRNTNTSTPFLNLPLAHKQIIYSLQHTSDLIEEVITTDPHRLQPYIPTIRYLPQYQTPQILHQFFIVALLNNDFDDATTLQRHLHHPISPNILIAAIKGCPSFLPILFESPSISSTLLQLNWSNARRIPFHLIKKISLSLDPPTIYSHTFQHLINNFADETAFDEFDRITNSPEIIQLLHQKLDETIDDLRNLIYYNDFKHVIKLHGILITNPDYIAHITPTFFLEALERCPKYAGVLFDSPEITTPIISKMTPSELYKIPMHIVLQLLPSKLHQVYAHHVAALRGETDTCSVDIDYQNGVIKYTPEIIQHMTNHLQILYDHLMISVKTKRSNIVFKLLDALELIGDFYNFITPELILEAKKTKSIFDRIRKFPQVSIVIQQMPEHQQRELVL